MGRVCDDVGGVKSHDFVVLCCIVPGGDVVWSPGQQFMLELLVKSLVTEGVLEAAIRATVTDGEGTGPSSDGLLDLVEQLLKMFTEKEIKQLSLVSGSHANHMQVTCKSHGILFVAPGCHAGSHRVC